ncbi:MAG: hypothetical protein R3C14_35400 [Caldilineaceae bacterium]
MLSTDNVRVQHSDSLWAGVLAKFIFLCVIVAIFSLGFYVGLFVNIAAYL